MSSLADSSRAVTPLEASSARNGRDSTAVRHRLVEMRELTSVDISRWLELRASNPALDSPYFHPGFAAAVAATRPGVRVIIGEGRDGRAEWFLPVQFDRRTARPAGFPAADFQGPICAPGLAPDLAEALWACGASSYEFDHMRDGLSPLEPWIFDRQGSPYIDLSGGMDGYMSRARGSGKHKIREAGRLSRKAQREHGAIRFVAQSVDVTLLETVIALKRRQYAATGSRDYFSDESRVRLLHRLFAERDAGLCGMLSGLYAGENLVAAHFGLRAGPVLHWWFPVYDPRFSRLDPGWMLLRAVIEAVPELGLARLDLGRGSDEWKRRAATGYEVVCQGAVIRNPLRRSAVAVRRAALAKAKASRVAPALRGAVQSVRRRGR
jgi:CelD/BcsL family acetyltransferase involved in cellulose biosynthesis